MPNTRFAKRVKYASNHQLMEIYNEEVIRNGLPLVIEEVPIANRGVFTLQWLTKKFQHAEKVLMRNCRTNVRIEKGLSSFIKKNTGKKAETNEEHHYAADIDSPEEWRQALENFLPPELQHFGKDDLMRNQASNYIIFFLARLNEPSRNLMIYVGKFGSYTAAHADLCSTYGHNLMICGEGKLLFIFNFYFKKKALLQSGLCLGAMTTAPLKTCA